MRQDCLCFLIEFGNIFMFLVLSHSLLYIKIDFHKLYISAFFLWDYSLKFNIVKSIFLLWLMLSESYLNISCIEMIKPFYIIFQWLYCFDIYIQASYQHELLCVQARRVVRVASLFQRGEQYRSNIFPRPLHFVLFLCLKPNVRMCSCLLLLFLY